MDATIKAQWLEALRSGKYKQGKGALHNKSDDSYCCLGVLCEVMGVPKFLPATNDSRSHFTHYGVEDDFTSCSLPVSVSYASGLTCYGGFTDENGEDESLAHLNDKGATFDQIAAIIEEKF